jgi:hypothetical protein
LKLENTLWRQLCSEAPGLIRGTPKSLRRHPAVGERQTEEQFYPVVVTDGNDYGDPDISAPSSGVPAEFGVIVLVGLDRAIAKRAAAIQFNTQSELIEAGAVPRVCPKAVSGVIFERIEPRPHN